MASKTEVTEGEAKVSTCSLGDIKSQISTEKLPFYSKEQLLYYCKELRLKTTGEKKDLIERLSPLGKCPELFDKKVKQITVKFSFPTEIPQPSLLSGGRYFRDLLAATKNGRYFRGVATFGGSLLSELYGSTFNSIEVFSLQQKTSSSHVLYREATEMACKRIHY